MKKKYDVIFSRENIMNYDLDNILYKLYRAHNSLNLNANIMLYHGLVPEASARTFIM